MRAIAIAIAIAIALLPATPAQAQTDELYPLVFPVDGDHHYSDTWGAPRSGGRSHEGTDIMAAKMVPVVAVAAGTVGWMHNDQGGKCCAMALDHDDDWSSWYIHLNNDTPGTDDGVGWGFAPGIERGVHVEAGQLIGYVGDSGNAEWTGSHLHFELHRPDGTKVNPYPHLLAAISAADAVQRSADPPCPVGAECDSVALVDASAQFHLLSELRWEADTASFFYGDPGDYPLMGDWDCDGIDTPAMYRSSNGFMYLRNANSQGTADLDYFYGDPSDIPLAGDFDGDGCDTLAIYRSDEGRVFVKNSLGTGVADYSFFFGDPGDKPFVGDFDGDGIDTVGLHRETTGFVYFRNSNDSGVADHEFFYGDPGDKLLAGDWDGDGADSVAVLRTSSGMLYVKLDNAAGVADYSIPIRHDVVTALVAPPQHAGYDDPVEPLPEPPATEWPPEVERWRGLVAEYFDPERVEEALSVISCESNGDDTITNPVSGAAGLFQFMETTWDWVAGEMEIGDYAGGAPLDAELNIAAAAWLVDYSIANDQAAWHHWSCRP
jgi:hypothetical protein